MMRLTLVWVVITCAAPLYAQTAAESSWEELSQLQPGQKVEVIDRNLRAFKGTYRSVSESEISLEGEKGGVAVQRDDVLRVGLHGGRRRMNAVKGAVIGALAGLAVGAWADYRDDVDGSDPGSNNGKMGGSLFGGGIGAALGTAFSGYRTIYRAKPSGAPSKQRVSFLRLQNEDPLFKQAPRHQQPCKADCE